MNLEEMRNRLAEIAAKITELNGVENHSDEQITEINALSTEFTGLKAKIEAKEITASMVADLSKPQAKVAKQPVAKIEVSAPIAGGFKNMGEFSMAVKNASTGTVDARFSNTAYESVGADGGYLIPEEFMLEVNKKIQSDESLLSKTRQHMVNGNSLTLNLDENSPWSGGCKGYWVGEGVQYTESKPQFSQSSWRLNKVGALVKATDELLEDAAALESYIKMSAPEAIIQTINEAIINGNGVQKPSGILNSGFKVTVAKEAAQAADTVVARNIAKMYSRMIPKSRANAVWYMNAAVEEQLRVMKDDLGNFIYMAPGSQMNQTPYGLLLGRPVLPMIGSMPALGDEGDIVFADLSYYYTILKAGGMKNAVSTHLYFDKDITAFKFTLRLDGKCPFNTPVTTQYGSYNMSGIVTLAVR